LSRCDSCTSRLLPQIDLTGNPPQTDTSSSGTVVFRKQQPHSMHTINLANNTPLASGSTRDVYWHPNDSNLLVKVIRRSAIEDRYGRGRPWYKTTRRYRHFISYLREVREEIALRAHSEMHPTSVQKVIGFADTDLGFGLVVEAAKDRQGKLAPALPQLIEEGRFDAAARADLEACLNELLASPVILADVHCGNLVYAWSEERGNHFVLIDGIGCKNLIPLNRLSRLVNNYSKRRRIARLMTNLDKMLAQATATPASTPRRTDRVPLAAK
jgi:hypothetical protein